MFLKSVLFHALKRALVTFNIPETKRARAGSISILYPVSLWCILPSTGSAGDSAQFIVPKRAFVRGDWAKGIRISSVSAAIRAVLVPRRRALYPAWDMLHQVRPLPSQTCVSLQWNWKGRVCLVIKKKKTKISFSIPGWWLYFVYRSAQSPRTPAWTQERIRLPLPARGIIWLASCHSRGFWWSFYLQSRKRKKAGMQNIKKKKKSHKNGSLLCPFFVAAVVCSPMCVLGR